LKRPSPRVLLPAALLAALAAPSPAALGPRYGGELRVAVSELPSSLAPTAAPGAARRLALRLVHETLASLDPDGQPGPGLAEATALGASEREWTLTLREHARFHDGAPVTAADVVRSLRAFARGPGAAAARLARRLDGGPAYRAEETDHLPGVAALDERRVVLRLAAPLPGLFAVLASPAAAITGVSGAGAGAFVPTLLVPGQRLAVTAFADHVRGRPYLDGVQVLAFADREAIVGEAEARRVGLAAGEAGFEAEVASLLLVLDPARPPFDRREARAAVVGAIDRPLLVGRLVPGGTPAPELLVPSILPPRPPAPEPGPASAPRLAGEVTLAVSRDVPPPVSQRVLAHLQALGLRVRTRPTSPAVASEAPADVRLLAYAPEAPEPAVAIEELLALAPLPPARVQAVRDRLDAADGEIEPERRLAVLAEAHDLLLEELTLVGLGHMPVRYGGRGLVHGARVAGTGALVLEDAWVEP